MADMAQRKVDDHELRRGSGKREFRLFTAVAVTVAAALAVIGGTLAAAIWLLGLSGKITQSTSSIISLAQLAFGLVAGVGATVGLVLAYRRHQLAEAAEARENHRLFNERFGAAATQLASELPAVRLAGVYSMAGLADDWPVGRQQCIDVLCANIRRGYTPKPTDDENDDYRLRQLAWKDNQDFRHALIRVIAQRLRAASEVSWQSHTFDLTGANLDGGDFSHIDLQVGTTLNLAEARFATGRVSFEGASFTGGVADFSRARFLGGTADFSSASLVDGTVRFNDARVRRGVISFESAQLDGGTISFVGAGITGGRVQFYGARLAKSRVVFTRTRFNGGTVSFASARFIDCGVHFRRALFDGGAVEFTRAEFVSGLVSFDRSRFDGSTVEFARAAFDNALVDFTGVWSWAVPPSFDFEPSTAPSRVLLPAAAKQTVPVEASGKAPLSARE